MNPEYWKGRSVLVTGGAGFLGFHLVEALVRGGARVAVLDCLEEPVKLRGLLDKIKYIKGDASDWEGPSRDQGEIEVIFHLAAFSAPAAAQAEPELTYRKNVRGTANLLGTARNCNVQKFIFVSAGSLYTTPPEYLPIDEKHPIDPYQGVYVTTKRIGELLCDDFQKNYGVPTLYFRLFNTYGPRQSLPFLIPSFYAEAMEKGSITVKNGSIRRDFTYCTDMVEALLRGGAADYCGGPLNLGSGVEHRVEEIARKVGEILGVEVKCLNQEVFGPTRAVCDNSLAKQVLGWRPTHSLDEGLRLTLQSFKEEKVLTKV